jgi:hypothetical protein
MISDTAARNTTDYRPNSVTKKESKKKFLSTYRFRRLNSKPKYKLSTYRIIIHALK